MPIKYSTTFPKKTLYLVLDHACHLMQLALLVLLMLTDWRNAVAKCQNAGGFRSGRCSVGAAPQISSKHEWPGGYVRFQCGRSLKPYFLAGGGIGRIGDPHTLNQIAQRAFPFNVTR